MEQNIPLEAATQHFAHAAQRGQDAGRLLEYQRIIELLRKHGHYDAILTLRKDKERAK
jgi:hypothetical protein